MDYTKRKKERKGEKEIAPGIIKKAFHHESTSSIQPTTLRRDQTRKNSDHGTSCNWIKFFSCKSQSPPRDDRV
jgi:hypothetical protein